ncbi:MAG: hypothetical protein WC661_16645 [Opitutaceae bacterium]|jgi:hypothetical protein
MAWDFFTAYLTSEEIFTRAMRRDLWLALDERLRAVDVAGYGAGIDWTAVNAFDSEDMLTDKVRWKSPVDGVLRWNRLYEVLQNEAFLNKFARFEDQPVGAPYNLRMSGWGSSLGSGYPALLDVAATAEGLTSAGAVTNRQNQLHHYWNVIRRAIQLLKSVMLPLNTAYASGLRVREFSSSSGVDWADTKANYPTSSGTDGPSYGTDIIALGTAIGARRNVWGEGVTIPDASALYTSAPAWIYIDAAAPGGGRTLAADTFRFKVGTSEVTRVISAPGGYLRTTFTLSGETGALDTLFELNGYAGSLDPYDPGGKECNVVWSINQAVLFASPAFVWA